MTKRTQAEALAYAEGVEAGRVAERTRCGNIAMSCTLSIGMDCDNRFVMDPETGGYECASETRGGVCECALKIEHGKKNFFAARLMWTMLRSPDYRLHWTSRSGPWAFNTSRTCFGQLMKAVP